MSLQFIIDGYNIIRHPTFKPHSTTIKRIKDPRRELLEYIKIKRPCGSSKNEVTVVFDGYPQEEWSLSEYPGIGVIFSRDKSADEKIKKITESSLQPKNIIVVSDDREIQFLARCTGAKARGVEEFLGVERLQKHPHTEKDMTEFELTYSQRHKINQELRKLWLDEKR